MENFDEFTKEQLIEKVNQLEEKNCKLDNDLYWANIRLGRLDTTERVLNALGVIFEFYKNEQK